MNNKFKLKIIAKSPKYFIHLLITKKINYLSLNIDKNVIYLTTDEENYKKIKKLKTSYKIKLVDEFGVIKLKKILKERKLTLLGFILFFLNVTFLSNIVFDVKVIHSDQKIRQIVSDRLTEYGLKRFNFAPTYKKINKIKGLILKNENNDIEWLEIERVGTKYIVKVQRRKKNKKEVKCTVQNIIAKKDSMILKINADSGEVVHKKFDYVKKGDVLISGLIHNKEKITSKVCARGNVYGEIWYKVSLTYPKNYYEENITGNTKKTLELIWLNKKYHLNKVYTTYKREPIKLVSLNILPFSINITKYLETEIIKKNYTLQNIDKYALLDTELKLKRRLAKDDIILSKKVLKKYEKNSKISIEVFFKVQENITDTENIEDIDIEKINEENEKKE